MKLNAHDTKEYIKLQLPIIKGELQQANNKINSYIYFHGMILSVSIAMITFLATQIKNHWSFWIGVGIFSIIALFSLFKIFRYMKAIRPEFNPQKQTKEINEYDIDIYYFNSYGRLSLESYLSLFTYANKDTENALRQVYLNSIIVINRYKVCRLF